MVTSLKIAMVNSLRRVVYKTKLRFAKTESLLQIGISSGNSQALCNTAGQTA